MSLAYSLIATLLYLAAGWRAARVQHAHQQWLVGAALLVHLLALGQEIIVGSDVRIGIVESLSVLAWLSAAMLWTFCLRESLQVLGAFQYPLTAVAALAPALFHDGGNVIPLADWQIGIHIVFSLISAGFLTLAAIQALATAGLDRLLRQPGRLQLAMRLPPLQTMERLLFQLIFFGFFLLSLTLLSGLLFVHNLFAQHLAHKTILSFLAWLIFGVLLVGRLRQGWRGRKAIRWTLSGYGVLILAYFGSKLILEQVLGRHWS